MAGEQRDEADGLVAKIFAYQVFAGAGFVSFVEEQIERAENCIEPRRQFVRLGNGEGQAEVADDLTRAHEPLRDGGFTRQKCRRDFRGAQSAQRAQRQCRLRLQRELRMAAHKHHSQSVVRERVVRIAGR